MTRKKKLACRVVRIHVFCIRNDFLPLALINYARYQGIDANRALDLTNRKFKYRIEYIEQNSDRALSEMTLSEMDALWDEAKST